MVGRIKFGSSTANVTHISEGIPHSGGFAAFSILMPKLNSQPQFAYFREAGERPLISIYPLLIPPPTPAPKCDLEEGLRTTSFLP